MNVVFTGPIEAVERAHSLSCLARTSLQLGIERIEIQGFPGQLRMIRKPLTEIYVDPVRPLVLAGDKQETNLSLLSAVRSSGARGHGLTIAIRLLLQELESRIEA